MIKFIELSFPSGKKITINLNHIVWFSSDSETDSRLTCVELSKVTEADAYLGEFIKVKETYEEIKNLIKLALQD